MNLKATSQTSRILKNVFIINAHHQYPFSQGKLNAAMVDKATTHLVSKGYQVKTSMTQQVDSCNVDEEIEKHMWADVVLLQSPVNWMEMPWSFKKYMDLVYTAGMDGRLCQGDGRSRQDPLKQYGTGGSLNGSKYMMSLTFNAPKDSFDDSNQVLFQGKSVDDLMFPMHCNFQFFGMEPLETFACFDVMKNPDIENDFVRFEAHLDRNFAPVSKAEEDGSPSN